VKEDEVENIRDYLEAHLRTSLTKLAFQTGIPCSICLCHKIVRGELAFTSIESNNCIRAPP
jgi:hypothetical protein